MGLDFGRYSFCLTGFETKDRGVLFHGNHFCAHTTQLKFSQNTVHPQRENTGVAQLFRLATANIKKFRFNSATACLSDIQLSWLVNFNRQNAAYEGSSQLGLHTTVKASYACRIGQSNIQSSAAVSFPSTCGRSRSRDQAIALDQTLWTWA